MAEWSKAAGCKPVSLSRVGSNPTFLTMKRVIQRRRELTWNFVYMSKSKAKKMKHRDQLLIKDFVDFDNFAYSAHEQYLYGTLASWKNYPEKEEIKVLRSCIKPLLKKKKTRLLRFLRGVLMTYRMLPLYYVLDLMEYKHTALRNNRIRNKLLNLNFTRNRFFPSFRPGLSGEVYVTMSLGLLAKYFLKPKCFTKSKTVYLAVASFLRKILLHCSIPHLYLFVKRTPRYFNEILAKINEPAIGRYKDPFVDPHTTDTLINECEELNTFRFTAVMFFNNKKYGLVKMRKRGRLKRKIYRRLVNANRVLD